MVQAYKRKFDRHEINEENSMCILLDPIFYA